MGKSKKSSAPKESPVNNKRLFNRQIVLSAGLIVILNLIVFAPAFNSSFLHWDDDQTILENSDIKNLTPDNLKIIFSSTKMNSYNPLVFVTFAVEYRLFGLNPGPYHIVNVIIHTLNTLLVLLLVWQLMRNGVIAFLTALLFCLHPMHAEAVVWVTALKDTLYSLFYLSSLISFLHYLNAGKRNFYYLSVFLFILSVFSKPVAVTLPAILLLIEYYLRGKVQMKSVIRLLPFIVISAVFSIVTIFTFSKGEILYSDYSTAENAVLFFYSIGFYIFKMFFPAGLSPVYPSPQSANGSFGLLFYLSPLLIIVLGYLVYRFRKSQKELIFASMFFLVTMLPVSNLLPVNNTSLLFDRYTYLPYLGFFMLVAAFAVKYISKSSNRDIRNIFIVSFSAIVIMFAYISSSRANVWSNDITLWSDVISKYAQFPIAYLNRGEGYFKSGNIKAALEDYNKGISLDSTKENFYNDRANVFRDIKEYEKALRDYRKALEIKPTYVIAINNMGILLAQMKKYDEAMTYFDKAISLKPEYSHAYLNIGNLYLEKENYDSSLFFYNKCISIEERSKSALLARGSVYLKKTEYDKAIDDFQRCVELDPAYEEAYQKLAYTYYLARKYNSSRETLEKMKKQRFTIDPKFAHMLDSASVK